MTNIHLLLRQIVSHLQIFSHHMTTFFNDSCGPSIFSRSYIISRNPIWRRNVQLKVFAVTTTAGDNPYDLESAVAEFLQQIRINATVQIVNMQDTDLADDFRAHSDACPIGSPTLTIGEKFRKGKDDLSTSSSDSGGQCFGSFVPVSTKSCLPMLITAGSADSNDSLAKLKTPDKRQYVAFVDSNNNDPLQRFLVLDTAKMLNSLIRRHSPYASLVVTHLPLPHKVAEASAFMEYVDTIFNGVDNMLLIQGTSVEYLTTVA